MDTYKGFSDLDLCKATSLGDSRAFQEIYERNIEHMFKAAYKVLRNEAACEDLIQEIFLSLWDKRTSLYVASLGGYLHNAVRNQLSNLIRKEKVKAEFVNDFTKFCEGMPGESAYPDKSFHEKAMQAAKELPEKCKKIFHLRTDGAFSNKEIAIQLGITPKTVENQITIALKKIKTSLGNFLVLFL